MTERTPQFIRKVVKEYQFTSKTLEQVSKKYKVPAATIDVWQQQIDPLSFMKDDLSCVFKVSKKDAALVKEILSVHEINHYIPDNFKLTEIFKSKI